MAKNRSIILLTLLVGCSPPIDSEQSKDHGPVPKVEQAANLNQIDEIIWVEGEQPDISLLHFVVTTNDLDTHNMGQLVVRHVETALNEAAKYKGKRFNVVFWFRTDREFRNGLFIGLSVDELQKIASEPLEVREKMTLMTHHWGVGEHPE